MANVSVKFTAEELRDIFLQAGRACYYWAETDRPIQEACMDSGILPSRQVRFLSREDRYGPALGTLRAHPKGATLTVDTVAHPRRLELILRGDASAADAVVQLLLFGDIVYG